MLPSTGYFKAINCPFYESGSCERPYCHFKHAKREDATTVGGPAGTQEARAVNQARDGKVSTITASDTDVLQQLVTEAVKKVLANREVTDTDGFSENVVCRVVEGLKPSLTPGAVTSGESPCATVVGKRIDVPIQISKPVPCVYNPTPIAELKKRHIPIVSYMPTRETRVAVKRKSSPDVSKPWLGVVVGESASTQIPEIRYKPTAIAAIDDGESSCNYVPTCKSDSTISSSYEDTNSGDYLLKLREEYYPKSKKRREEYIPKKVKAPLKTVGGLDETSLGQFESEFHVIDKILTTARVEPRAVSCENSQDSCSELEPKFSDDEEVEHRNECGGPTDDNSEVENVAIDGNNRDRVGTDNVKDGNDDDDDDDDEDEDEDDGTNVDDDESTRSAIKGNNSIREVKAKIEGICVEDKRVNRADSKDETKRVVDDGCKSQRISTSRSPRRENTEGKDKTYSDARNRRDSNKIRSKDRSRSSRDKRSREDSKESQKRERDSNAEEKRRSGSHRRSRERSRSKKSDRALSDSHERKDPKRRKKERTVESKEDGEGKDKRKGRDKERNKERKRKERGNERESSKSNNSALSIKKEDCEKKKDRSREDRRRTSSRTTHKSNDESCRNSKLKKREKNDVIRKRSKRSVSPLESVRFVRDDNGNSVNGDEEDEEEDNYEYKGQTDNGNENDEEDDDDLVLNLSDSDHDVHEECLKIFQEYQVPEQSRATLPTEWKREVEEEEDVGRKRVAHPSAAANVTRHQGPNRLKAGKRLSNPQQKMYERWRLMREVAAEKAAEKAAAEKEASGEGKSSGIAEGQHAIRSIMLQDGRRCREMRGGNCAGGATTACNSEAQLNGNGNGNGNGRVRIAHVPYARSLAMEKRTVAENAGKTVEARTTDGSKTAAQTAKSGVRVAHVPQAVPQLIRPEPLQVSTQKFSLSARQYFVNMMHDVCVQIYTNAEDAAQRAVKEEFSCHERCKALPIYKNLCMLAAHRLRKEVDQALPSEIVTASASACRGSVASGSGMVSHETVLAGKSKGSWSVLRTKRSVMEFKGAALYGMMKKWILTEQQLRDNGFPRPHPDGQKGRAKVYVTNSRNQNVLSKVPNERICGRCGQSYAIDRQGFAVRQENCIYHWGRKFTFRGESRYSCCRQDGLASGCCDAKTHVWDYTDYENLRGYVRTLPKVTAPEKLVVYALDCEMSYTTQGLELTRVTVIDDDCNVVYEALVKPQNPIIDYNTRFSGITEETMKNVTTTLLDVQATLLTMFSDKTILVGHSLESDFAALRLLHDTVVDTSIMFPHKNGYPQKRALKNLCSDYLRKIIQNDVGGHDSKEDAVACMELILWKAKEEAKLQ